MIEQLSNNWLEVLISSKGAELQSIKGKKTGLEYLWQGDPEFWERRSPVLFPNVGHLFKDVGHVNGVEYPIPMHGIVKDAEFEMISNVSGFITYRLQSTPKMHRIFPFPFTLDVIYKLRANHIEVKWIVENTGITDMPFHIGGHPGINYPNFDKRAVVHGYVDFEHRGSIESATVTENMCIGKERYELPIEENGLLPLTNALFDSNAVIIDKNQVKRAKLLDKNMDPYVTIEFNSPVFLLWSPEGQKAPFVCLEPWHGLCDPDGYKGELLTRHYNNVLAPNHKMAFSYKLHMDAEALKTTLLKRFRARR